MTAAQHAILNYINPSLGVICEFGVGDGTSLKQITSVAGGIRVFGFDWFQGLPEDWVLSYKVGHFSTGGVAPDVPGAVMVPGLFKDSIPVWKATHKEDITLLHVDCDLYRSAMQVLCLLNDRIKPGTVIVFDEFQNIAGVENHEMKAFTEWIETFARRVEWLPSGDTTADYKFRSTFRVLA